MSTHSPASLTRLVNELRRQPAEAEWLEFKKDNTNTETMGQNISAIANAAALAGKTYGYLVWGIDDATHEATGTTFRPRTQKKGGEELENWLLQRLAPRVHFQFFEAEVAGQPVVVLQIGHAFAHPVRFIHEAYIRVGSYTRSLKDFPEKEAALWRLFDHKSFEHGVAAESVTAADVLARLDVQAYFDLQKLPQPTNQQLALDAFVGDGLIRRAETGDWDITNLGALLLAKRLDEFPTLKRKAVRVIQYRGLNRLHTVREQVGGRGYANGFEGLITYLTALLPANEVIGQALRQEVRMYPEAAIRELVANALVHQDLAVTGTSPMIEIFDDRIEISNPGVPLVATDRFLNAMPRSRNEALASLLHRMFICEERGTGIDKVVAATEEYQLPAPLFEREEAATRATLFAHRPLAKMDRSERVRACYLHACLRYAEKGFMTNTTLRQRFGFDDNENDKASRLIREAVEAKVIVAYDPTVGARALKYVPHWADPSLAPLA